MGGRIIFEILTFSSGSYFSFIFFPERNITLKPLTWEIRGKLEDGEMQKYKCGREWSTTMRWEKKNQV